MDTSNQKTPKSKPKKRRHKQRNLDRYASYTITCLNCGFNYNGQFTACPKCKTLKGHLT